MGRSWLTKTSPLVNVSAGQSVPYTIIAKNPKSTPIVNSTVTDLMPAGFHFRAGSGSIDGKRLDPTVNGRELAWTHLSFAAGEIKTFTLVLTVGAGGGGGDFVNQAMAYNSLTHALISNVASATVRIVGDPSFDCPDLIGKVFDDAQRQRPARSRREGHCRSAPGDRPGPLGHDGRARTLSHRLPRDPER